mgnify:CR=1 FL=1
MTMYEVRLTGWKRGVRTVSLIELIRRSTDMSLKNSKRVVEDLLAGKAHTFSFTQSDEATIFREALADLGVQTE